jgi:mono/diheme cytochrome c family protein
MQRLARGVAAVVLTAWLAAGPAAAQDVNRGQRLAEQWCSNCHAVERRGSDSVPTLQQIANLPGRDTAMLRTFLTNPHPPMPPFQIGRDDIDDLVAYITSLRQR